MKVTIWDFVLCTIVMGSIFLLSVVILRASSDLFTMPLFGTFSMPFFGAYHVAVDIALMLISYGLLSAITIRILTKLRPLEVGQFDMDDANFTYWKLLAMVYEMGQLALKPFAPLPMRPLVMLLFGVTIGKNAAIGGSIEEPYLVKIGNDAIIGHHSLISGSMTSGGKITFGRVTIGNNVTIGANSVVMPGVTIGDGAVVGIASVVLPGTVIPAGEQWRGNPARKWA